ncbi:MAG: AIR synthase-related protein, partial [Myxococcota bacterium]
RAGAVTGPALSIDLEAEQALQACLRALAQARVLSSAHDVSDGGLGACLAESCIAGGRGASVRVPGGGASLAARLFAEEPSRVVLSFPAAKEDEVRALAQRHGVPLSVVGEVGGADLVLDDVRVPVRELARRHAGALDAIVGER